MCLALPSKRSENPPRTNLSPVISRASSPLLVLQVLGFLLNALHFSQVKSPQLTASNFEAFFELRIGVGWTLQMGLWQLLNSTSISISEHRIYELMLPSRLAHPPQPLCVPHKGSGGLLHLSKPDPTYISASGRHSFGHPSTISP